MMMDAMIEVDSFKIIEKQTAPGFQKKWMTPAAKGELGYPGEPQELACWDMLKIAETLHNQGPNRLPLFSVSAFDKAKKDAHTTFATRIDKVCYFLSRSKRKVDSLLRGDSMVPFVASVSTKMKANKELQKQIHPGKGSAVKKGEDGTVETTKYTEEPKMIPQGMTNSSSMSTQVGIAAQDLGEFGPTP
jgi:hypothetical protein